MKVNPQIEALGEYAIGRLQEQARALRAQGKRVLDFSIGDPLEPTPAFIPEALKAAVPEVSQYPTTAGLAELRAAVAGYVNRRFGVSIDPDTQVMPTSGSKESIFSSALAFVDRGRGDVIAWPTPGYPIYERGAMLSGAIPHPVRLQDDFILRADDIAPEVWKRAALVWICSPHNPAGSITGRDDLARLVDRRPRWQCSARLRRVLRRPLSGRAAFVGARGCRTRSRRLPGLFLAVQTVGHDRLSLRSDRRGCCPRFAC